MTRYNLIVRDKTYLKLMQYGAEEGKSFGKLVNEILDNWALTEGKDVVKMCVICGNKVAAGIKVNGVGNWLCEAHAEIFEHAGYQTARLPKNES